MADLKKLLESNKQKIVSKLKESTSNHSMADELFDDVASDLLYNFDMKEQYDRVGEEVIPYYAIALRDGSVLRVDLKVDNTHYIPDPEEDEEEE